MVSAFDTFAKERLLASFLAIVTGFHPCKIRRDRFHQDASRFVLLIGVYYMSTISATVDHNLNCIVLHFVYLTDTDVYRLLSHLISSSWQAHADIRTTEEQFHPSNQLECCQSLTQPYHCILRSSPSQCIYIYIIYTPNLGLVIAGLVLGRKHGCFTREYRVSTRGAGRALRKQQGSIKIRGGSIQSIR